MFGIIEQWNKSLNDDLWLRSKEYCYLFLSSDTLVFAGLCIFKCSVSRLFSLLCDHALTQVICTLHSRKFISEWIKTTLCYSSYSWGWAIYRMYLMYRSSVGCRKWLYREYLSIHSIVTQLLLVAGTELQVFLTLSHLSAQRDKTNAPSYVHRILLCVQRHMPGSM